MDIFTDLVCVRMLAETHEMCLKEEKKLEKELKPLVPLQKIQAVEEPMKEKFRNWAIFGACEVVFAMIINNVLNFVLSYLANDCMTYDQRMAAGYISYHNVTVFFGVGAVLAIPLALLAKKLIAGLLEKFDASETARAKKANEEKLKHNLEAEEENKRVTEFNRVVEENIENLRKERKKLLVDLKNTAPWYDPAYFSLEAVDYVTAQIKSGKARTLDEAYAQYELSRHR